MHINVCRRHGLNLGGTGWFRGELISPHMSAHMQQQLCDGGTITWFVGRVAFLTIVDDSVNKGVAAACCSAI